MIFLSFFFLSPFPPFTIDTFRTRFHHWPSTKAGQTARNRATMQIADTRTRFSNIHLGVGVTPRRIKDDSRRNLGADWHARGLERVEAAARLERGSEREWMALSERASERERDPFSIAVSFRVGSHAPVGAHVPSAIANPWTRLPRTKDTLPRIARNTRRHGFHHCPKESNRESSP